MRQFHLFGGHGGKIPPPFVGFEQDFIGQHIQFLLCFALYVIAAGFSQHIAQAPFADRDRNVQAGTGDDLDQEVEVCRDATGTAMFFDEITR